MKNRLRIVIPVLSLLLVVAVMLALHLRPDAPADYIGFSGNLELREAEIAFRMPGRLVALEVEEGDSVEAAQLLARLDDEQFQPQKTELLAQTEVLRSRQEEVKALIAFQRKNLEAQLGLRRAELSQAREALSILEEGSRPQEVQQASAALAGARSEFERAKADFERAQDLNAREDISKAQFDQFRATFERAESARRQAEERLALVEEGPRKQEVAIGRAAVVRAESALEQTQAGELEIRRNQRSLQTMEEEFEALQARIAQVDKTLEDTRAFAPFSGVVLTKPSELGEVVAAGTPVATVGDLLRPWVRAYIGETDLGKVNLGDPVELRTDSFPGKVYQGKVSFISSQAEFTPKQIETREERVKMVYRIKVEVENPHQELKLNMPVEGEIHFSGGRDK